ncbi:uncharacterized protein [Engystomops pustulosus]|uniref:uncharacterized protein n=1 Tax=Engystomops pustulosus TaxID=76066 RepID=UPI003AFAD83E
MRLIHHRRYRICYRASCNGESADGFPQFSRLSSFSGLQEAWSKNCIKSYRDKYMMYLYIGWLWNLSVFCFPFFLTIIYFLPSIHDFVLSFFFFFCFPISSHFSYSPIFFPISFLLSIFPSFSSLPTFLSLLISSTYCFHVLSPPVHLHFHLSFLCFPSFCPSLSISPFLPPFPISSTYYSSFHSFFIPSSLPCFIPFSVFTSFFHPPIPLFLLSLFLPSLPISFFLFSFPPNLPLSFSIHTLFPSFYLLSISAFPYFTLVPLSPFLFKLFTFFYSSLTFFPYLSLLLHHTHSPPSILPLLCSFTLPILLYFDFSIFPTIHLQFFHSILFRGQTTVVAAIAAAMGPAV